MRHAEGAEGRVLPRCEVRTAGARTPTHEPPVRAIADRLLLRVYVRCSPARAESEGTKGRGAADRGR